jgi:hypothetical protein
LKISALTFVGELHILLRLVREWEHYSPQKYELFQQENLAAKLVTVAKNFFTVGHHLQNDEELVALLTDWLRTGDGSCFAKTHIEMSGLHKLEPADLLAIIQAYAQGTLLR